MTTIDPTATRLPTPPEPQPLLLPGRRRLLGADVLQTAVLEGTLPLYGDVKLVTSLFFDLGVYLIVLGLVLDILRSLGAELDRQAAPR